MKSLLTLIKLQKTKVDEQRIFLLKLQEQLAHIDSEILRLNKEKAEQEDLLHVDSSYGMTYADYLRAYLNKMQFYQRKRNSLEYAVNIARDKLAELFEEQKRYEIALQNRREEEAREELRQETHVLDEVGSVGYLRRKRQSERK
jgi:flagellar export protein FliJ